MEKKNTFLILFLGLSFNFSSLTHANEDHITTLQILLGGVGITSSGFLSYAGYSYLKNNNPKLVENSKIYLKVSAKSTGAFLATLGACFFGYQSANQIPKYFHMPAQIKDYHREEYFPSTSHIVTEFSLMLLYPTAAATCGVISCKLAESAKNDLKKLIK